jgi:hypothetical protein
MNCYFCKNELVICSNDSDTPLSFICNKCPKLTIDGYGDESSWLSPIFVKQVNGIITVVRLSFPEIGLAIRRIYDKNPSAYCNLDILSLNEGFSIKELDFKWDILNIPPEILQKKIQTLMVFS